MNQGDSAVEKAGSVTDAGRAVGRAFSIGLVSSGVIALVALVRSKVVAVALGPVGLGMAAEVTQVVTVTTTPAGLAGGPTLIRAVARSNEQGDVAQGQQAYDAAFSIATVGALLAIPVALMLAHLTLPHEWGGATLALTAVAGFSATLVMMTNVMAQVLIGSKQLRLHALATIASAVLSVLGVSVGVTFWGLRGFFGGTLVASCCAVVAWGLVVRSRGVPLRMWPRLHLSRRYVLESLHIGGGALAGALGTQISLYMVRTSLGRFEGPGANGLFQACWSLEGVLMQSVLTSLGNAVFPRYAAAEAGPALVSEMNDSARFLLRVVPPIVLVAIAGRELALPLLYSEAFSPAAPLLGLILAGDLVRTMAWSRAGALLYRGRVGPYIMLQALGAVLFGGGSLLLVPQLGAIGVGWAFVGTYCVHTLLNQFVVRSVLGVPINWRSVMVCYAALAVALATSLLMDTHGWGAALALGTGLIWAWRARLFGDMVRFVRKPFARRRGQGSA